MAAKVLPEPLALAPKAVWDNVPFIISHMPREFEPSAVPAEDALGAWITNELDRIMGEFLLQESERTLWARREEDELPASLWVRVDELIIRQTVTLGDWMEHSALVQQRIQTWKLMPHGEEIYKRYNAARDKNMRILRRLELPPVDPRFKQFKEATVRELRIVLQDLRDHFTKLRRKIGPEELRIRFSHTIAESGCTYLQANQLSWETFFASNPVETVLDKPASLFDEWAAWATTHELVSLRQKISLQKL